MTRRLALRLMIGLVLLAAAALLTPGSPVYFPNLLYGNRESFDGHSTGYWIKELDSSDSQTRQHAIFALGAIGDDGGEAVPALAKRLHEDPDPEARYKAALALSKMCPSAREAVPELAEALDDDEPFVRVNAAMALFRLGGDARSAIPALIRAVEDEANLTRSPPVFSYTTQELAVLALGRASAGSSLGVPVLMTALENAKTTNMRRAAARALGDIGAEARLAVPQLRAMLKDKDDDLRQTAESALDLIGSEEPSIGSR
ncbi:MAG: HEAT repeat domain-containing protein [Gemmataceae bacterium]